MAASACLALSMLLGCARTGLPGGIRPIEVETPMPAPAWALKERELLDVNARAAALFEKVYVLPNGHMNLDYQHGGGVQAPDDVFECLYKFPLLYALGADEATWRVWWKPWRGSLEQCTKAGLFVNEFCKYLDWHHNGEHYESFFLAALCAPDDPEYRRQALKFASFYDGTHPAVPNYDPDKKIIRSVLNGGAGPVLRATREQWDERGGAFWDAWLECGHDGPVNLVTTCFATNAFMLTGDQRARRGVLDYINAWRERARRNGGIIPTIVKPDGTVPDAWWGGVMGWDFKPFGGLFQVSSGPRAAWANALLLTGDASYYDTLRTLADELWGNRITGPSGKIVGVPRYRGSDGWYGSTNRPAANGVYASILANIYLATMSKGDLDRVLERQAIQGMCGHAHYHEGGYEPEWIRYLVGQNPTWPEKALDHSIAQVGRHIEILKKEDTDGPAKRRRMTHQVGWCGPLVNLMTGGIMPLWTGQLLLSRFRYFDPERRRPGIPVDCAALVEAMTDDSATLVLVNTSHTAPHTALVQTGAYAEHQCLAVRPEGGVPIGVKGTLFAVRLAPGAGRRFVVSMKRYANAPTLRPPWKRR